MERADAEIKDQNNIDDQIKYALTRFVDQRPGQKVFTIKNIL